MKRIDNILTIRNNENLGSRSWDIVFEWEDIISKELNIPIKDERLANYRFRKALELLRLYNVYAALFNRNKLYIQYVTDVRLRPYMPQGSNIIPIIIDFWYEKEEIKDFISYYKNAPLVLVTNKEVLKVLDGFKKSFPVEHFPLSLPDQYAFKSEYCKNKIYDFAFFGRQNPFFTRLIERYADEHPDFEYVFSKGNSSNREYYSNKGKFIGKDSGRASYIDIIRKTKISCYTTPGMDESKSKTSVYNQVTPRVLEMLANGCQVIGHYPLSDDVIWYNLPSVVPNVDNYEQFSKCLDRMRNKEMDIERIDSFLKLHYTSCSASLLDNILKKYNIIH